MESMGVLLVYPNPKPYLEEQLGKRFNFRLFRLYEISPENRTDFLRSNSHHIRALVGNAAAGADAETIDLLSSLEIVSSFSVGLDKVDLDKCRERRIRVTNTPDVLTDDVADLAISLAVAVLRRICAADRYVRSGAWTAHGAFRLASKFSGKKVGILGLGRIGSAIARRAEAFGCPVSYYSRSEKPNSDYKYCSSILELAAGCEVLMVACSLGDGTRHIVGRQVMDALGPGGVLVNVARGPLVDEAELVSALVERRLGGAGLDVFEQEPEPPKRLLGLDNVVVLPHVGSGTRETREAMADLVVRNLEAHVHDEALLTSVSL